MVSRLLKDKQVGSTLLKIVSYTVTSHALAFFAPPSPLASFQRNAFILHLMQQAFEFLREPLLWDGENREITNLTEANQFVGRIGWEV